MCVCVCVCLLLLCWRDAQVDDDTSGCQDFVIDNYGMWNHWTIVSHSLVGTRFVRPGRRGQLWDERFVYFKIIPLQNVWWRHICWCWRNQFEVLWPVRISGARHGTTRHGTTAQHSTAQHSTAQPKYTFVIVLVSWFLIGQNVLINLSVSCFPIGQNVFINWSIDRFPISQNVFREKNLSFRVW